MKQVVLIVDDDKMDRRLLRNVLEDKGLAVLEAVSGEEALKKVREDWPALLILDLNLGGFSGLDICAAIKNDDQAAHIPIIVLTGDDETGKNVACLDQGADDYMTKPFDRHELVARVNAVLRRINYGGRREEIVKRKGISIDLGRKAVMLPNRTVENLTPKEFAVLYHLVKNSPNLVSRKILAKKVWNSEVEIIHERTIDVHIRRIRLKLGAAGLGRLVTVSGSGYKFI